MERTFVISHNKLKRSLKNKSSQGWNISQLYARDHNHSDMRLKFINNIFSKAFNKAKQKGNLFICPNLGKEERVRRRIGQDRTFTKLFFERFPNLFL